MTRNKNIAIFIDGLSGGGAEKSMLTLANALVELGHSPVIFAMTFQQEHSIPNGVRVEYLQKSKKLKVHGKKNLLEKTTQLKKIVLQVEREIGEFDLHLSNLHNTHVIVSKCNFDNTFYILHSPLIKVLKRIFWSQGPIKYFRLKAKIKYLQNKNLIVVSKGMRSEIENSYVISPNSINVIYNPIDLKTIRKQSREQAELPEQDYLIHVGRSVRLKRHDILFKAFKDLKESKDLKLVCLSTKPRRLKQLAKKFKIQDKLILPGFQENPYPWIANAKALILCSDLEGFGNVLVESIACGTIPISTNCPFGPNEILDGAFSELLVPMGDSKALTQTIDRSISNKSTPNFSHADILVKTDPSRVASQYLSLCR